MPSFTVWFYSLISCCISIIGIICSEGSEDLQNAGVCWCKPGYSGPNGFAPCQICKFSQSSGYGNSSCGCLPGAYGVGGASPCLLCDLNSYSSPSASQCSCNANYYSSDGYAPCNSCPVGSYALSSGSTTCQCSNRYHGENGNIPCDMCPANSNTWMRGSYMIYGGWSCDLLKYSNYQNGFVLSESVIPSAQCNCDLGFINIRGNSTIVQSINNRYCDIPRTDVPPCVACPIGYTNRLGDNLHTCLTCVIG